jgi:carboxymethylenebutenolidase
VLALSPQAAFAQSAQDAMSPVISSTAAPPGTEVLAVEWVKITRPGVDVMLAAVARPQGAGPFPVVLLLHGSHGFAEQYVRLARDLSEAGFLAVAACWFQGGGGAGARFVTSIPCSDGPARPDATSPEAMRIVQALLQAVSTLPDARADRVALFGHSRGGGATLNYVLQGRAVQAAIVNSAGYPKQFAQLSPRLQTPILMLHGTADSPADGGSPLTNVQMARDFESALRAAGKPVEAAYYDGSGHNAIFTDPGQYRDEVQRMRAFLQRHLRD